MINRRNKMVEMQVSKVEWSSGHGSYVVILTELEGERSYPLFVDELEAQLSEILNNQKALLPYKSIRLLRLLLTKAKIEKTKIEILKQFGDISAKVFFSDHKKPRKMIFTPGVAIEVALRFDVLILIQESLLADLQSSKQDQRSPVDQLVYLEKKLRKAVGLEDYETAAKIRDLIFKLQE